MLVLRKILLRETQILKKHKSVRCQNKKRFEEKHEDFQENKGNERSSNVSAKENSSTGNANSQINIKRWGPRIKSVLKKKFQKEKLFSKGKYIKESTALNL